MIFSSNFAKSDIVAISRDSEKIPVGYLSENSDAKKINPLIDSLINDILSLQILSNLY